MRTKFKIVILSTSFIALMVMIIIFNIPHSFKSVLNFSESEQIAVSIVILENVLGTPTQKTEIFNFEKGSNEFTSINKLFDRYSYNLTIARDISNRVDGIYMATISISDGSSGLYLINSTGSNIEVNGVNYRMKQNKIEELIREIIDICAM